MNAQKNSAALLGRSLLAGTFVFSGFLKITGFEDTVGYIATKPCRCHRSLRSSRF